MYEDICLRCGDKKLGKTYSVWVCRIIKEGEWFDEEVKRTLWGKYLILGKSHAFFCKSCRSKIKIWYRGWPALLALISVFSIFLAAWGKGRADFLYGLGSAGCLFALILMCKRWSIFGLIAEEFLPYFADEDVEIWIGRHLRKKISKEFGERIRIFTSIGYLCLKKTNVNRRS